MCSEAVYFRQAELLCPVIGCEEFGFLNAVLLISRCRRVELLERLNLIINGQLVLNVIEEILLYSLSDVCFDLS